MKNKNTYRSERTNPRVCKMCGTKLNENNTYSHSGRRVTYCKDCEKHRVQMNRLRKKGCTNKCQYSYEAYRNNPIFFASMEEKRQYLLDRKLIKIGDRHQNDYSSVVGKNCHHIDRVKRDDKIIAVDLPILCDECHSILRFDINVELVCENCGLISEVLFYEKNDAYMEAAKDCKDQMDDGYVQCGWERDKGNHIASLDAEKAST